MAQYLADHGQRHARPDHLARQRVAKTVRSNSSHARAHAGAAHDGGHAPDPERPPAPFLGENLPPGGLLTTLS